MMPKTTGLTPKQKLFAAEYLIDHNATQAAIRAGYSAKSADVIGYQLLGKTSVSDAITGLQAARSSRTEITQDWALTSLQKVYERCMDADTFNAAGACRAIELISKILGLLSDRVQLTGAGGGPIAVEQADKPIDPELLSTSTIEAIFADLARNG